ncbi:uncharacterized protein LOC116655115 [Drosophila ananassae]|uniref:uncharacterized protein LOC116655115 n=1 Tax=Drosophila ananassae TaxID=7217 RepID=UPI0013A5C65A|nr:uncharacterized protein LOC116655115 [Drosophila ananassae]
MSPKIICDLCLNEFTVLKFTKHYGNCKMLENASEIMRLASKPFKKRPLQSQNQQNLNIVPELKKSRFLTTDNNSTILCSVCKETYNPALKMRHLMSKNHKSAAIKGLPENNIQSEFPIMVFSVEPKINECDLQKVYLNCKEEILKVFLYGLGEYRTLKFSLKMYGSYHRPTEVHTKLETKNFETPYMAIYELESLEEILNDAIEYLNNLSRFFLDEISGWSIKYFEKFEITLIKLEHLPAGSYVPTPENISKRTALVHVQNKDNFCFKWSILAAISLKNGRNLNQSTLENPLHYLDVDISKDLIIYKGTTVDFSGIEFPITRNGIKQFELNNRDFSINVFELDDNEKNVVGPTIRTDEIKPNHINLLALYNEKSQNTHYTYIKSIKELLYLQYNKYNPRGHFCLNCLEFYSNKHCHKICEKIESTYPKPNTNVSFETPFKKLASPVVIYANIDILTHNSKEPESWAASFYVVYSHNPSKNKLWTFRGSDAISQFLKALGKLAYSLYEEYWMKTGKYIDIERAIIPVVFKELSKNIILLLNNALPDRRDNIKPIPCYKGSYSVLESFRIYKAKIFYYVHFIDAGHFLEFDFDKVASVMGMNDFKNLYNHFPVGGQWEHIDKKIIFPKTYMSSFSKSFDFELPPLVTFLEEGYSIQNYRFAQQVWANFGCTQIQCYIDLYLKQDVLILADVFEYFRFLCQKNYDVDPTNCTTKAELSWDAMLKVTEVNLDLISDPNMYDFLKRGTRGPLIHSSPGIVSANNKYMRNFSRRLPSKYLACIEAKNLTDWAMSQPLPLSNFRFLNKDEIEKIDFQNVPHDGSIGYMLEVDLKYPAALYNSHRSLPFCPEGREEHLGPTASLTDKKNYVIHLKNLQLCVQHGLVIEKIHQVLSFQQECWLKPFVDYNAYLSKESKNEFEKQFFNSMNLNIDKCMQPKKMFHVIISERYQSKHNSPGFRQLIARHNFHKVEIFGKSLAAIESKKQTINYDKPIYIGSVVLELSKWFMYDQYYNSILPQCPSVRLLYIDSDLVFLYLKEDFYELIRKNPYLFDTSNYRKNNKFKILKSNNEIGLIRDKKGGRIMQSFQTESARSYSVAFEF